ncbi:antigen Sm21.7 [Clonorchis sinensis]|uniref:Antigen Sm21.7 n=1 Tax=Clonorchis sinensis TaxID=79923 RepID=G7YAK0_CLOSI|nr:antigen Sm21.7 [Clonorchis sinensis]
MEVYKKKTVSPKKLAKRLYVRMAGTTVSRGNTGSRRTSAVVLQKSQESTPMELSRRSSVAPLENLEESEPEETQIELSPSVPVVCSQPPEEFDDNQQEIVLVQDNSAVCSAPSKQLGKDIEVISAKMSLEQQILLSDETRSRASLLKDKEGLGQLSKDLKAFAEKNFGEYWQVAIVRGDFWATFSHLADSSFQFHMNGRSYLFWKTS